MTWTYVLADLATSQLFQVRYLVGDTIPTDQQVQDEEINFAIAQRGSTYGAAAMVCRALASKLAREADTVDRELRTSMSQRSRSYAAMANGYELQASVRSGGKPYAGGISIADRQQQIQNTDRVPPQYEIGMQDNYIPEGIAGNEESAGQ